ncbi:TPA: FMN-binding protein [Streptococcus suis]|nr:FMN-binding protein [Streptococcus suis]HEL2058733.1 FMN-binding protein [Streptococcus suis]
MKKKITALAISFVALVTAAYSGFLLFFQSNSQEATDTNVSQQASSSTPTASSTSATSSSSASAESNGSMTDGTYTGAVTSTDRGDYQVQITVSGGVMTDITILEYPSDNPTSESINAGALPTYEAEALESQSADVNAISGATEAFKGFTGSLQDALDQATA